MTPEEYECITSQVAQSIYERVEGITPEQVRYGRENRWQGASGYRHQIDASVRGPQDLILVECKRWKSRVPVGKVLEFYGRIQDISCTFEGQVHGVMVSTAGFQSGAKVMAKHFKIDLQQVQSAGEFGFAYKKLLLIQRAPATARTSTSGPTVVVSGPKERE